MTAMPRPRQYAGQYLRVIGFLALIGVLAGGGCSSGAKTLPAPLAPPPTVMRDGGPKRINDGHQRVVVIGMFENPGRPSVKWRDIGSGMSKALAQTILNRGEVDVWIDARLSQRVQNVIAGPVENQARDIRRIKSENQNLRWVIVGQVTDFSHTSELPKEVISNRDPQAIVALQFDVIDVDAMRIVISDHVLGVASAGSTPPAELYGGLAFGSYVFWNTPLGLASATTLELAMARIDELLPGGAGELRVTRRLDARRVRIGGTKASTLRVGAEYFVCRPIDGGPDSVVVEDPITLEPVVAKVIDTGRNSATAVLRGIPPEDVPWDILVLRRDRPSVRPSAPGPDRTAVAPTGGE
jgi:hypothetical protein